MNKLNIIDINLPQSKAIKKINKKDMIVKKNNIFEVSLKEIIFVNK